MTNEKEGSLAEATHRRWLRGRTGAMLWMLCLQFFLFERIVAHFWRGGTYRFTENYISDLGAIACGVQACSPLHSWMNTSFVVQGVLIVAGAFLVRQLFAPWRAYSVALWLAMLCGGGVLVVGFVPEDANNLLHSIAAIVHFLSGALAMLLLGALLLRDARTSTLAGWASTLLGLLMFAALALLGLQGKPIWQAVGLGVGTVERILGYGIPLWFAAMGTGLLVRRVPNA